MQALTLWFRADGPRISVGLELFQGRWEKAVFLGQRGAGRRWREVVKPDRYTPPSVARGRVVDAGVYPFMPKPHDQDRPASRFFRLASDDEQRPGLLIRINTWSPDGPPGDWPDIDSSPPMPCGYGAYDEAGTQTYKDGLVVMRDGDELPVTVAAQRYLLRVQRGRLLVEPRSGG